MPKRHLEHRLEIHAPIERAWRVLTDVARYPDWNRFVTRADGIEGEPDVGGVMRLPLRWDDGP